MQADRQRPLGARPEYLEPGDQKRMINDGQNRQNDEQKNTEKNTENSES
jgi:hypothetical protein